MKLPEVTNIVFHPVGLKKGSFLGYISFILDGQIAFNECSLHRRDKGNPSFRVVYPDNKFRQAIVKPIAKEVQDHIDREVSAYILAQKGYK